MIPNLTFAYFSDGLVKNHQLEEDGSSFLWLHIFWMQELLISRVIDGYFVSAIKEKHDPLHVLQFHLKLSWRNGNIYIYTYEFKLVLCFNVKVAILSISLALLSLYGALILIFFLIALVVSRMVGSI